LSIPFFDFFSIFFVFFQKLDFSLFLYLYNAEIVGFTAFLRFLLRTDFAFFAFFETFCVF